MIKGETAASGPISAQSVSRAMIETLLESVRPKEAATLYSKAKIIGRTLTSPISETLRDESDVPSL